MKLTKHFEIWEWADFVRNVGESTMRSSMETHLSSGCEKCGAMVRVLGGFAAMAPIADFEPSRQAIRRAEAIFPAIEKPSFMKLVYDSFREPLPAGMRAQDALPRHALYEAGKFFLDLQLDHEPASGLVTLVGQLSNPDQEATDTTDVPVLLMTPKGVLASVMCNQVGEFQLEYMPARNLRLHVLLPEVGERLDVGLDRLSPLAPRSTAKTSRARRTRLRQTSHDRRN